MTQTRIKFCGLTRAGDIDAAVELGVDAIGFVLVPGSKRALDLSAAAALRSQVPATVRTVLLFRDADAGHVRQAAVALRPDLLQFHGNEPADFCEQFGLPYLFAIAMGDGQVNVAAEAGHHPHAAGILLDSHRKGGMGGQGETFDWSAIPSSLNRSLNRSMILAGGLGVENVALAIRQFHPYAVDVSSGIESSPGIKDYGKMRAFIEEVGRGERS